MKNFLITVLGVLVGVLLLGWILFTFGWIELPSTGSDSTGSDSTGSDSTGSDSTGSDSTGSDSTGNDSTGSDSTGSDSTGPGAVIAKSGLNHAFTIYNGEATSYTIDCYSGAFVMNVGSDSDDLSVYYGIGTHGHEWIVDDGVETPDYVCYHIRASEAAVTKMNEYAADCGIENFSWKTKEYESYTDSSGDEFFTILKRVAGFYEADNYFSQNWSSAAYGIFFGGEYSFLLDVYAGYFNSDEQLVATIPFAAQGAVA